MTAAPPSTVVDALRAVVGTGHVLVEDDLRAPYETDWTRRYTGRAAAVVRPADTAAAQVTVGAGATLEQVQRHARAAGLDVGLDLAARAQATVGGLIATNAGGVRVPRHGAMRAQVAGVEAVLADGTVLRRLGGLAKDNTGYDLAGLLCGSEGTLAVLTAARLRLVPVPAARAVALVAVADTVGALDLLAAARAGLTGLSTVELFYPDGMALVRRYARLGEVFPDLSPPAGAYLLLECEGRADPSDELLAVLGGCAAVRDATVAADAAGRARLWAYRERHTEAIGAAGVPVKLDVCVPLAALPDLVDALPAAVRAAAPAAELIVFGHLGEANLHVNVLAASGREEAVTGAVLGLVAALGGAISSEHGIGRAKAHWLYLSRTPAEIAAMRAVKAALDPYGLLSPGVLFPAG